MVVEMPEGQDMIADFSEMPPSEADIQADGDINVINTVQSQGYELRLLY